MFAVGLEFRIAKLARLLPVSGFTGLIQMGSLLWAGVTTAQWLGWNTTDALFLGASIAISSTMVVTKVFEQRPVAGDVREMVFGVLVLQDVVAIALIAVMTAVSEGHQVGPEDIALTLGKLAGTLVLAVVAGLFVVPKLVRFVHSLNSPEALVVSAMGLCFGGALLAVEIGYSVALGAFVAGILVAESGRGHEVEEASASLKHVFAAVFFVAIGMTVDPEVAAQHAGTSAIVLAVVVVGQLVSVSLGGILSGNGLRRSIIAGTALGQTGEFAFIIASIGIEADVVEAPLQPVLVTVALCSTLTTSWMLGASDRIVRAVHHAVPGRIHTVLSLYEMWFEKLRRPRGTRSASRLRASVLAIAVDGLAIALVSVVVAVWRTELGEALGDALDVRPRGRGWLVLAAGGLCVLPFFVALVVNAQKLSRELVRHVLAEEPVPGAGRWLSGIVATLVIAGVGIPMAAVLRPVSGIPYIFVSVLAVLALIVVFAWRAAGRLQHEVRSGAGAVLDLLSVPGTPEEDEVVTVPGTDSLLPGLDRIATIYLHEGDHAIGATLAQLDLRAKSGANVLAIRHSEHQVVVPTGSERLEMGDTLVVAGTTGAVQRARRLLREGRIDPADVTDHGMEADV